jgi:hypothetical protein
MWFTFDPRNPINQIAVPVARVKQIIELNRKGEKAEFLVENNHIPSSMPDFISSAGEDSITRFDRSKKRRPHNNRNGRGHSKEEQQKPQQETGQGQNARQEQSAQPARNNEKRHKRRKHPRNNKTNPAKNEKQQ